jgi:tRNA(Ile)-lysidine synthase
VHIDHGLRATSAQEAEVVHAAARALGVSSQSVAVHVGPGPDLEARARAARYEALPEGVLVGHTADDQAETLLLNLMRGAGLDGLAAMRAVGAGRRSVGRPMLGLRRRQTHALVRDLGLATVTDPTNAEARFRRNRARDEVLPLLADVAQRDPVPLLARTARLLGEDAELLAVLAAAVDPTDTAALRAAHPALGRRALREWIRRGEGPEQHPSSAAELERAWAVVTGDVLACELTGGRRLRRSAGRLRIEPRAGGGDAPGAPPGAV